MIRYLQWYLKVDIISRLVCKRLGEYEYWQITWLVYLICRHHDQHGLQQERHRGLVSDEQIQWYYSHIPSARQKNIRGKLEDSQLIDFTEHILCKNFVLSLGWKELGTKLPASKVRGIWGEEACIRIDISQNCFQQVKSLMTVNLPVLSLIERYVIASNFALQRSLFDRIIFNRYESYVVKFL